MSQVLRFEVGDQAVFRNPDTLESMEFKITAIIRSLRGASKDLLEGKDGFNARAEFCTRKGVIKS